MHFICDKTSNSMNDLKSRCDSIPSLHWELTCNSIAPAQTQCIATLKSKQTLFYVLMKIISSNFLHSYSSECQTTMKIPPIRKRKASHSSKSKCMSKHIEVNVVENGTTTGASPSHDKGPSTAFLTAIQEGFVQKSANMANAITEAFKSFKANFKTFPMMMTLKRKIRSIQTVRANQCDNCDLWYQTKCCSGCDKMYRILASSPCTWVCVDCGLPSFSNSLIETSLDLFNSFSLLDSLLQEFSSLQQATFTEPSNDKPNKERRSNKNNLKTIRLFWLFWLWLKVGLFNFPQWSFPTGL